MAERNVTELIPILRENLADKAIVVHNPSTGAASSFATSSFVELFNKSDEHEEAVTELNSATTQLNTTTTEINEVTAEHIAALNEEIKSLKELLRNLGDIKAHSLSSATMLKICDYDLILTGEGVPSATTIPETKGTPAFIGQKYLDLTNRREYTAFGTSSSDWIQN